MELTPDQKKKRKRIMMIVLIIVFLLLATAITVYFVRQAKQKKALKESLKKSAPATSGKKPEDTKAPAPDKPAPTPSDKPAPADSSGYTDEKYPLEKGMKGDNVFYLKRALNRLVKPGYEKLKEDNLFDNKTYTTILLNLGTKYYPVTRAIWNDIMDKSHAAVK